MGAISEHSLRQRRRARAPRRLGPRRADSRFTHLSIRESPSVKGFH
jgi:hypothetical protein